jgi:hypothetical protein
MEDAERFFRALPKLLRGRAKLPPPSSIILARGLESNREPHNEIVEEHLRCIVDVRIGHVSTER